MGRFVNADGVIGTNNDMTTYNMYAYCGNNPVVRSDPTGMMYEEVGFANNYDLDTLFHTIGALVGGESKPNIIYDILTTGIGFIQHPAVQATSVVISVATLGWSLFGRSPKDELNAIRYIVDDVRYRYRDEKYNDFMYIVRVLNGSHTFQFKLEVYEYYCGPYRPWKPDYYLLETVVFNYYWHISSTLHDALVDADILTSTHPVEWGYTYTKKS